MSSSISRLIWAKSPSSKLIDKSLSFHSTSNASFLKNKENTCNLLGTGLQYFTKMSMNLRTEFITRSNINPPPANPLPSGSSSGSLRNWIVGMVLTLVLPFFTHKWGSWLLLKYKVDTTIKTTEQVTKTIEKVAERVDNVIDNITDGLPKGSKLKEALEFVDEIAEGVAKTAHVANDIIDKVEEAEEKLESLIHQQNVKGEEESQQESDKN